MPLISTPQTLAAVGRTGNNTETSVNLNPEGENHAIRFEITVAGATPTITFKVQGSLDPVDVADGSSDWFDLMVLPSDNDTAVATATKTAVGNYVYYLEFARRFARKIRLVTSANTNVTYECNLITLDTE